MAAHPCAARSPLINRGDLISIDSHYQRLIIQSSALVLSAEPLHPLKNIVYAYMLSGRIRSQGLNT